MTKKKKLLLKIFYYFFISLVLLFLAGVCLGIIFYASGYELNWQAKKIEKTGMLVINSDESGLKLFLDNKEVTISKSLSASIFNSVYKISLLPGEYDLEIKKDGRKSYLQKIKVEPELVTKIENILLLPKAIPDAKLIEKNITRYSFSPDNKKVIYQTADQKIFIYDLEKKQDQEFTQIKFSDKVGFDQWDQNSQRVILETPGKASKNYYLIDIENPKNSFLFSDKLSFLPLLDQLFPSPTNANEYFGLEKNTLYKINPDQNSTEKIAENIDHLILDKNHFYYSDGKNLIRLDPNSSNKDILLENFELAYDFNLKTINRENDVYFINNGSLYFIKDNNNLELIDNEVKSIIVEANDQSFFYTKDFEIWHYDGTQKNMLTRFSKEIQNLQEFFEDKYLLYQQEKDINLIKKDGLFFETINNNILDVKVLDKDKILIIEKSNELTSFRVMDLSKS